MNLTDLERVIGRFAICTMSMLFIVIGPSTENHSPPAAGGDRIVVDAGYTGSERGSGSWPADQDPDTVSLSDAPLPPRSDVAEVSLTSSTAASVDPRRFGF